MPTGRRSSTARASVSAALRGSTPRPVANALGSGAASVRGSCCSRRSGAAEPRSGAAEPRSGVAEPRSGAAEPRSGAAEPRSGAAEPSVSPISRNAVRSTGVSAGRFSGAGAATRNGTTFLAAGTTVRAGRSLGAGGSAWGAGIVAVSRVILRHTPKPR